MITSNHKVENVIREIRDRFGERLDEKGLHGCASIHEILGVMVEEHEELKDAVGINSHGDVRKELLDIIVGALWGIVSLDSDALDW
jgi:hypothetical protein